MMTVHLRKAEVIQLCQWFLIFLATEFTRVKLVLSRSEKLFQIEVEIALILPV